MTEDARPPEPTRTLTDPPPDAPIDRSRPGGARVEGPPAPERVSSPAGPPEPDGPTGSADPAAQVDTREIPLAVLQAAAQRAMNGEPGAIDVDLAHVDLVEAERREAAEAVEAEAQARPAGEVTSLGLAESLEAESDADADPTVRSPIDPRIRERRVAVTRAEGRRRLRILLTLVVVASVIGIAWLVVQSPFLAVRTINVRGASAANQIQVQNAAKVEDGAPLLFVDTDAVARRIEALPWVAKANVDKDLPNDLTITVVERAPAAWVRRKVATGNPEDTIGAAVVVDRHGRVLGDAVQPPAGAPELKDISSIPSRGGQIRPARPAAAVAEMPKTLRDQTAALVHGRGGYVLKMIHVPDGPAPAVGEVRLGSLDEIGPKSAAALAVIYQLALDGEQVDYVDVRVPGAPATK